MRPRFTQRLLHPISILGCVVAVVGFAASVVGLVIDITVSEPSAYQGLLTLVLFPSVVFLGFAVVALGMWLEGRRWRKAQQRGEEWQPRVRFDRKGPGWIIFLLGAFTCTFVVMSIVGAYHAYEFTESTEFCGELCHTPMSPQSTAHQFSAHANIACTHCHVGPGFRGYFEAKVSGIRQLLQMVGMSFPRPIHAGHDKLLIAGRSCERCHRKEEFWRPQLDSRTRFGYDLRNTPRPLRLLLRANGKVWKDHEPWGHWHESMTITFRAADESRQTIPWVKVERPDGTTEIYEDGEEAQKSSSSSWLEEQTMTCVDCHSRPAHVFHTPEETVNSALASGLIDRSLPFIKKVAVAALARQYGTTEEAVKGIENHVRTFYSENFAGKILEREETLAQCIATLQGIYRRNIFPEMRANWTTYPDNASHRKAPGCFRCHSGRHTSQDGQVLERDCTQCHVFYERARDSETLTEIPADGSTFHPFEHSSHEKIDCWTCHTETSSPYTQCRSCHEKELGSAEGRHAMAFECSVCHKPGAPKTPDTACGSCHPAGDSKLHATAEHRKCIACHQRHEWSVAAESCSQAQCHADKGPEYLQENLPAFRGVLKHMSGLPVGKPVEVGK